MRGGFPTEIEPVSSTVSLGLIIPLLRPAIADTSLNVEPGA
jgi:hypothetical protein